LFASFFLGEYGNILLMSGVFCIFFLGGGQLLNFIDIVEIIFSIKLVIIVYFFIFVRANLPRFRFDQLM